MNKSEELKKVWAERSQERRTEIGHNISKAKKGKRSKWMDDPEASKIAFEKLGKISALRFAVLGREKHELFTPEAQAKAIANSIEETKTNPIRGKFETNMHAKAWSLSDPNGNVYRFRNLSHFIRNHKSLFADYQTIELRRNGETKAWNCLARLAPWRKNRGFCVMGGWTWEKI